jgi:hypothetical protein
MSRKRAIRPRKVKKTNRKKRRTRTRMRKYRTKRGGADWLTNLPSQEDINARMTLQNNADIQNLISYPTPVTKEKILEYIKGRFNIFRNETITALITEDEYEGDRASYIEEFLNTLRDLPVDDLLLFAELLSGVVEGEVDSAQRFIHDHERIIYNYASAILHKIYA